MGINAAQLATAREGGDGDTFLTIEKDPGSVERLCFGAGVPVPDSRGHYGDGDGGMRRSYTFCPIWQAEKQRIEQGREQLAGGGVVTPPEHEPTVERVSHGVPEPVAPIAMDDGDPWASARRDLDAVAPPADATSDAYGPLSQRG